MKTSKKLVTIIVLAALALALSACEKAPEDYEKRIVSCDFYEVEYGVADYGVYLDFESEEWNNLDLEEQKAIGILIAKKCQIDLSLNHNEEGAKKISFDAILKSGPLVIKVEPHNGTYVVAVRPTNVYTSSAWTEWSLEEADYKYIMGEE